MFRVPSLAENSSSRENSLRILLGMEARKNRQLWRIVPVPYPKASSRCSGSKKTMRAGTMKKWTHDELAHDLALYLQQRSDPLMVWEDMQLGSMHSARPDVYTIRKSYSAPRPMVYEIKVTAQDYRSDVGSGKWQKYLPFCSAVVFAVPRGLVTKKDLPEGCGLIVRSEKGWRMAKGPTLSATGLGDLPPEMWMKLVLDGVNRTTQERARDRATKWIYSAEAGVRLGKEVRDAINDKRGLLDQIKRLKNKVHEHEFYVAEAKRLTKEIEREAREKGTAQARDFEAKAREQWAEVSAIIGVEPGLDPLDWKVNSRIRELARLISVDAEAARKRSLLSNIEQVFATARTGSLPEQAMVKIAPMEVVK
jgi:hypothetical protein